MSISSDVIRELRRERGWSQEQLAAVSGLSERTIQRIETEGTCSLDSKMALASAFELPPSALSPRETPSEAALNSKTDWAGAVGLFICGLLAPIVVLLTATNRLWEISALGVVVGLTVMLSIMSHGARATWVFFDRTSWIVRYPVSASGISGSISHARMVINTAYAVGLFASAVTGLAITIYGAAAVQTRAIALPVTLKPLIYAALFSEFWIRPFKRKLQSMLARQMERETEGACGELT